MIIHILTSILRLPYEEELVILSAIMSLTAIATLYFTAKMVKQDQKTNEVGIITNLIVQIQKLEKEFHDYDVTDSKRKIHCIARLFNSLDILAFHINHSNIKDKNLKRYSSETLYSFALLFREFEHHSQISKSAYSEFRKFIIENYNE